ncbi:hypothetical protein INT45_007020 [Circinella minor]|uniref:Uncharacterized protein n=1 Tax=Circinella minor TaxID=1195481 RepID=A0A8H7S5V1_9FUNG|nr:hypothetical protein INT45_007020 [Circinella minor]
MRLVTESEQNNASSYAMKGFAVGAAQWGGVGLFASALAYSFFPWYRRTQTVNKFYIVMCFALGGGAYKSDRYMVNFERRGRAQLLDETTRQRYELIYGSKKDEEKKVPAEEAN